MGYLDRVLRRRITPIVNEQLAQKAKTRPVVTTIGGSINNAKGVNDEAASKAEYRGTSAKRVNKARLEAIYASDPICFAGVNWISALTGANGFDLEGEKSDVKVVEEFHERVRFEAWIKRVATNLAIHGTTFNEIIPNKEGTIISSLYMIDAKSMDFGKKEGRNKTEVFDLDNYGRPKFYVQHPYDWDGTMNQGREFKYNDILCLRLRTITDELWGVGVLEPIYRTTMRKMNIEEALAEAIYKVGFPVPIMYVGDKEHEPSANEVNQVDAQMKNFNYRKNVTLAYHNKLDVGVMAGTFGYANVASLNYYLEEQIAGIGIPKSVIMGSGEGANRATLEQLTEIGARNIESIHRSIEEGLNGMVYKQMLDKGQISGLVKIKFRPLKVEEKFTKMDTLIGLMQAGLLTPEDDLELWIRNYLELPKRIGKYAPKQYTPFGEQIGEQIVNDIKRSKTY